MSTSPTASAVQGWDVLYGELKAKLDGQFKAQYGEFHPFSTAQVVFPYCVETDPAGGGTLFNHGTYDFLNTRIKLDNGAFTPQGGALGLDLTGAYRNVTFAYSGSDRKKMTDATNAAQSQGDLLVTAYQSLYGVITADQIAAAKAETAPGFINTPIDYIVGYVIRYLWAGIPAKDSKSGAFQTGVNPYTATDLRSKLPFMPPSASSVYTALGNYIAATQPIGPLIEQFADWMQPVGQLVGNCSTPSTATAWMKLVETTGATSDTDLGLRWTTQQQPADLLNSLGLTGGAGGGSVTTKFTASRADDETMDVTASAGGSGTIPVADFLGISLNGKVDYSYNSYVASGETLTIVVEYPGVTYWSLTPKTFDGTGGWVDATVLQQAVDNGVIAGNQTAPKTGYALATESSYDWSDTGNFGLVKSLIISRQPSVTITYTTSNESDFYESLDQSAGVGISLFGVDIVKADEGTSWSKSDKSATDGSFTVTIDPPDQQATGLQTTAWTLGGQVTWPGVGQV